MSGSRIRTREPRGFVAIHNCDAQAGGTAIILARPDAGLTRRIDRITIESDQVGAGISHFVWRAHHTTPNNPNNWLYFGTHGAGVTLARRSGPWYLNETQVLVFSPFFSTTERTRITVHHVDF